MRLWVRSKSRVLNCSSSWRTWKVTAGWVICSASAALVKLKMLGYRVKDPVIVDPTCNYLW